MGILEEERIQKLKEISKEAVDIRGIGFYSLGSHRKNLTKEQLENYMQLLLEKMQFTVQILMKTLLLKVLFTLLEVVVGL